MLLYKAQTTGKLEQLVEVFQKMSKKELDEKLQDCITTIEQVSWEND